MRRVRTHELDAVRLGRHTHVALNEANVDAGTREAWRDKLLRRSRLLESLPIGVGSYSKAFEGVPAQPRVSCHLAGENAKRLVQGSSLRPSLADYIEIENVGRVPVTALSYQDSCRQVKRFGSLRRFDHRAHLSGGG